MGGVLGQGGGRRDTATQFVVPGERREGYLDKVEAGVIRPLDRWYQVRGGRGGAGSI